MNVVSSVRVGYLEVFSVSYFFDILSAHLRVLFARFAFRLYSQEPL